MTGQELYEKWIELTDGSTSEGYTVHSWRQLGIKKAIAWDDLAVWIEKQADHPKQEEELAR